MPSGYSVVHLSIGYFGGCDKHIQSMRNRIPKTLLLNLHEEDFLFSNRVGAKLRWSREVVKVWDESRRWVLGRLASENKVL